MNRRGVLNVLYPLLAAGAGAATGAFNDQMAVRGGLLAIALALGHRWLRWRGFTNADSRWRPTLFAGMAAGVVGGLLCANVYILWPWTNNDFAKFSRDFGLLLHVLLGATYGLVLFSAVELWSRRKGQAIFLVLFGSMLAAALRATVFSGNGGEIPIDWWMASLFCWVGGALPFSALWFTLTLLCARPPAPRGDA